MVESAILKFHRLAGGGRNRPCWIRYIVSGAMFHVFPGKSIVVKLMLSLKFTQYTILCFLWGSAMQWMI